MQSLRVQRRHADVVQPATWIFEPMTLEMMLAPSSTFRFPYEESKDLYVPHRILWIVVRKCCSVIIWYAIVGKAVSNNSNAVAETALRRVDKLCGMIVSILTHIESLRGDTNNR